MQLNLGKGTLESLERELLPVALGNPQKSVYRRLLVEIYGAMAFPLVHSARLGDPSAAAQARAKLATIGARAVKPLLSSRCSTLWPTRAKRSSASPSRCLPTCRTAGPDRRCSTLPPARPSES
jgi:hypothetical protein